MKQDLLYNCIAILVCFICIMLQHQRKSQYIKAVQLQNYVWLIGFLIYLFGLVPYYSIKGTVYICAMLYLLSFNAVYLLSPTKERNNGVLEIHTTSDRQKKKCIIASIVCWIASIPILNKTIPILVMYGPDQGMNALRYRTYGQYSIFNTSELMLIDYIIRPIMVATILLLAQEIGQKRFNLKLIIVSVLDAFWLILATAGRSLLVTLIIYVSLSIIIVNGVNLKKILFTYKKYILPGTAILSAIIIILSKRINRDGGILKEGIIYYFSGLPFFSKMLDNGSAESYALCGKGSFSFIIDLPIVVLRTIGVLNRGIITGQQYLSGKANDFLFVGDGIQTNATASTLFAFYSDFGIIGTIVGGFILGGLALYIEKKLEKDCNCLSLGRYIYLLSFVMATTQSYPLTGIPFLMKWVFIYILLK